ncbi:MAG TPA: hypothetical protein PK733_02955 [Clostridiales bacterium]|nr:hypothetical protein [Clostridiales bacterium]
MRKRILKWLHRSIVKLIVILVCGTVIPELLLAGVSSAVIQDIMYKNFYNNIHTNLRIASDAISVVKDKVYSVANNMVFNTILYKLLTNDYSSDVFTKYKDLDKVSKTLFSS